MSHIPQTHKRRDNCKKHSYMTPCALKCLEYERSKFGKQCSENGGLLKCCINTLTLEEFDKTRVILKQEKLIKKVDKLCSNEGQNCHLCVLTVSCTKKDVHTGVVTQK